MTTSAKTGSLDWARRERAAWERLLDEVGEARMTSPGAMGDWSSNNRLCHLTTWQILAQSSLDEAVTGVCPAPPWPAEMNPKQDQTRVNQFIHEQTRDLPLPEVIREGRRARDRVEDGIAALPDKHLSTIHEKGEAFGARIVRETTAHYPQDREASVRAWLAGFRAPADDG